MTPDELRAAATLVAARVAREVYLDRIQDTLGCDTATALRVQETILTAEIALQWENPGTLRKSRVVAILASPIIIPVVATLWLVWRIDRTIRIIRRRPL